MVDVARVDVPPEAVGDEARARRRQLVGLAVRYNIMSRPQSPEFISALMFDPRSKPGTPKARFSYVFPSPNSALISMPLRHDLSETDRKRTIELIEQATREPAFGLERDGKYLVTGVPVVVGGLADAVQEAIFILLIAALIVMALMCSSLITLLFRLRDRLLAWQKGLVQW